MTAARAASPGRVLVTGALGFVGLNIARRLAERGWQVIALTRRDPDDEAVRFLGDAAANVHWRHGDVTDGAAMTALVAEEALTHLLHAAAVTATPDEERADPARVFTVNAGGTLNLLEAARRAKVHKVQRLVYVSSSGLYGAGPPTPAKREDDPVTPRNLYTIAKLSSEQLCRRYAELYGLSIVSGRLGSAYGPLERVTGSRHRMSAIHQLVHAALAGAPLTIYGADVARDFCHVDDVAAAFVALLETEQLNHPLYNVAGPRAEPLQVALDALGEAQPGFRWRPLDRPDGADIALTADSARAGLDTRRLQRDTGWRPRYDLRQGTIAYLRWERERQAADKRISGGSS